MVTIYYNAESVLHAIDEWAETLCFDGGEAIARGLRKKIINELPTIEVQNLECDCYSPKYCPCCGARMDGDDE